MCVREYVSYLQEQILKKLSMCVRFYFFDKEAWPIFILVPI
jgi:hypothetical protein